MMKVRTFSSISLTDFAVLQFIKSFRELKPIDGKVPYINVTILGKLYESTIFPTPESVADGSSVIEVEREEVGILKNLIELRMLHCEQERDQRSEAFNADTYIGLRYLRLELHEWLLGESISESELQQSAKPLDSTSTYSGYSKGD
jgi:hypothetical protein